MRLLAEKAPEELKRVWEEAMSASEVAQSCSWMG